MIGARVRRQAVFGVAGALAFITACGAGEPKPAALDARNEACRFCRMAVSDARFAAQIAAPGEEPLFFDDVGCLAGYLREAKSVASGAAAFVADHRTGEWVLAARAVYAQSPSIQTPMNSHILTYASAASRDEDPAAHDGRAVPVSAVFPVAPPEGRR